MATGSVLVLAPESTSANMKLFQEKMKDRIPAVAMPPMDRGRVMWAKAPMGVSPSTWADSSNSSGMESK